MEIINEEKFSEGTERRTFMRFPYRQIQTNRISPSTSSLRYVATCLALAHYENVTNLAARHRHESAKCQSRKQELRQ